MGAVAAFWLCSTMALLSILRFVMPLAWMLLEQIRARPRSCTYTPFWLLPQISLYCMRTSAPAQGKDRAAGEPLRVIGVAAGCRGYTTSGGLLRGSWSLPLMEVCRGSYSWRVGSGLVTVVHIWQGPRGVAQGCTLARLVEVVGAVEEKREGG